MPAYCRTCGHVMDRHRPAAGRKGAAPCGSKVKSGLCTCRGFTRVPPKTKKLTPVDIVKPEVNE